MIRNLLDRFAKKSGKSVPEPGEEKEDLTPPEGYYLNPLYLSNPSFFQDPRPPRKWIEIDPFSRENFRRVLKEHPSMQWQEAEFEKYYRMWAGR